MTLTLHAHPLSSYCWKVLIALYENRTPFEFHHLDPMDGDAAAAFAALWPIGKMPALVDHDLEQDRNGGRVFGESSIIIEHLAIHHPGPVRLIPQDQDRAIEVRLIDRILDNYVMTPTAWVVLNRIRRADRRDPLAAEEAHALLDRSYGWLETRLRGRTWAAGEDFSLADCSAAPSLHYADRIKPRDRRFPHIDAYVARLESRPSFARVLKEAEPYAHLFPQGD